MALNYKSFNVVMSMRAVVVQGAQTMTDTLLVVGSIPTLPLFLSLRSGVEAKRRVEFRPQHAMPPIVAGNWGTEVY